MKTVDVHRHCGGRIVNRKCQKCGKTWSRLKYPFAQDVETKQLKFDEKAYRRRIREGRDIP
jgi:hypothetical protein